MKVKKSNSIIIKYTLFDCFSSYKIYKNESENTTLLQ